MNDLYMEYNTGRIPVPPIKKVTRNLMIAAGVLLLFYTVLFYPILWTFAFLLFVWAYYYNRSLKYEYEYIILNDEMHIDKIVNNLKRKKAFRGDLKHLELLCDDPALLSQFMNKPSRTFRKKRFNNPFEPTLAMVLATETGYMCLYLQRNDEMIDLFRKRYPLKVKITKSLEETDQSSEQLKKEEIENIR